MRLHGGYPLGPQLPGNPGLASTGPSPLAGRVLGAGDGTRGMLCPGGSVPSASPALLTHLTIPGAFCTCSPVT